MKLIEEKRFFGFMIKRIFGIIIILLSTFILYAQDKSQLQNQRNELRLEIQKTQDLLDQTQKTTTVNIRELALINKKVSLQENVVTNIRNEIRELSDNIYLSQLEINRMNRVLDTLKQEYSESMVYAYKNRGNYSFLNFIFSAKSFNDAIKRIAYLKSYRNHREVQAGSILKTQSLLEQKIKELDNNKVRKTNVLKEQGEEGVKLQEQRAEQAKVVNDLKGKQKELRAIIASKKKEDDKLKNTIAAMVRREIERARAEAARKERERQEALRAERQRQEALRLEQQRQAALAKEQEKEEALVRSEAGRPAGEAASKPDQNAVAKAEVAKPEVEKVAAPEPTAPARSEKVIPKVNSVLVNTDAEAILNNNFETNRGKLPWPVNGFILYNFGNNTLPGNVTYYNYGVTIACNTGEPVKAVFDGEVTLVNYIENNQTVYVKHGQYFTVYSNLTNVTVNRGDRISTGQVLGRAGANDEGQGGRIDFLLLKESDYQNPQAWLK